MTRTRRATADDVLGVPLFRRFSGDDLERLAEVSQVRRWTAGERLFSEGDPSDHLLAVATGRVMVFKITPAGHHLILEIFGPGDPVGAVAVYEERPYPATAVALEDTETVAVPRGAFFRLLDEHPTLVRGLLAALTRRLVELTVRLSELTGGPVEARIARLFLKLASDLGEATEDGVHIPLSLSRQELADLTGTTIETCIRVMSRWGKQGVVRTEDEGFTVLDPGKLKELAAK